MEKKETMYLELKLSYLKFSKEQYAKPFGIEQRSVIRKKALEI